MISYVFGDFSAVFLLLISSLVPLQSKSIHTLFDFYSFNLLRCVLWLRMWSILESVPRELEKSIYPAAVGWYIL